MFTPSQPVLLTSRLISNTSVNLTHATSRNRFSNSFRCFNTYPATKAIASSRTASCQHSFDFLMSAFSRARLFINKSCNVVSEKLNRISGLGISFKELAPRWFGADGQCSSAPVLL